MLANPECPACGASDWTPVGERVYRRPASLEGSSRKPTRVLFELWAPGAQEFRVQFAGCNACGMMIYRPRPSAADLEAKYRALAQYGDSIPSTGEDPVRTRKRSQRVYDILAPHLGQPPGESRILDFGGGDGRLLQRFVEAGATCELVDYCEAPVQGVRQVGSTVDALPADRVYDAMICSHVVEHLADPASILGKLAGSLKLGGAIYVEVPLEVVKRMPAQTEPVTHCNFFIPESLRTLLERSGFEVLSCRLTAYPHPNGGWMLCVGAIGTPGEVASVSKAGLPALQRYLKPSLPFLVQLRLKVWRSLPRMILRKVRMRVSEPAAGSRPPADSV